MVESATGLAPETRRCLSKRLSALLAMPPARALSEFVTQSALMSSRRIGFSGPPGAGKSSLIAAWSRRALDAGRRVGVLAIDPSSPISSGSLLGDRIRMDDVTEHPAFFLRSVPSRSVHDGLCPNAALLLNVFDEFGFDDVVLETVGVGQAEYASRVLVHTFVVVLNPQAGDVIQAMKAGILEVADILVVNKADLDSADRMVRELAGMVALRPAGCWSPPVVPVSVLRGTGLDALDEALTAHARAMPRADIQKRRDLRRYGLQSALTARMDELLASYPPDLWDGDLAAIRERLLTDLPKVK